MAFELKFEEENHLSFPEHPSLIEEGKFMGREDIAKLSVPSSVYKISPCAFKDCKNLAQVYLGESVSTIEKEAFSGCEKLFILYLPSSITYIAEDAFSGCFENVKSYKIYGYEGSYAEKFANDNGLSFIALTDEDKLEKAKELFDQDIDSDLQVMVFREAMLNRFNPVIQMKGTLYLAIAYLIGRGVPESDVLADQTMSLSDSYYEFSLFSPLKDESKDQLLRVQKRIELFFNEDAKEIREMIRDVELEKKSVLECKSKLYPKSLTDEDKEKLNVLLETRRKEEKEEKSKDSSFRILYLHGLKGSKEDPIGKELKEKLPYLVKTIDIPSDPYYGMLKVKDTLESYHPDLIVAHDFSCLYALRVKAYSRILIHPWLDTNEVRYILPLDTYPYENGHLGKSSYLVDYEFMDEVEDLSYIEIDPLGVNYAIFSKEEKDNSSYQMFEKLSKDENIYLSSGDFAFSPTELTLDIIKRLARDGKKEEA